MLKKALLTISLPIHPRVALASSRLDAVSAKAFKMGNVYFEGIYFFTKYGKQARMFSYDEALFVFVRCFIANG